jgi:hypothetical protein
MNTGYTSRNHSYGIRLRSPSGTGSIYDANKSSVQQYDQVYVVERHIITRSIISILRKSNENKVRMGMAFYKLVLIYYVHFKGRNSRLNLIGIACD